MSTRRILLLGTPRVEADQGRVQIGRRKALGLLAYLLVTRQPVTREALAGMFWADSDLSRGLAYLRTTLWTLNQALGEDWALLEDDTVRYNTGAGIADDLQLFETLCADDDVAAWQQAVGLYRDDFMAGFSLPDSPVYEEWQFLQAERLRTSLAALLDKLILHHAEAGAYADALPLTRRRLSLDTLHEPAHRMLMLLYAHSGQRAAALRQYQELTALLESELQTAPEAETTRLYESIRGGQLTQMGESTAALLKTMTLPRHATQQPADSSTAPQTESPARPVPPAALAAADGKGRSTLPVQTTPFVGRENELTDIARLLFDPQCRLLTLLGPGGMGKTRLAIRVAERLAQTENSHYPDGAFFVPLAPVRSEEFVLPTIIEALSCAFSLNTGAWSELLAVLHDKRLLLLLDNFEHLLPSATHLLELLAAAPGVKLLVTSRERLNITDEWVYELRGLEYPRSPELENGGNTAEHYSAVRLFEQAARRARPNFALNAADLASIAQICRMVDGMPLGIELAAAWAQMLSCAEIASEIQKNLDFLASPLRNVPERHRTLRAVFEHSWQALNSEEQACLSRLSAFHGGFAYEAAHAVAEATLHLLLALVGKSLLRRNPGGDYELHELLRQFAENKLDESERTRTYDRHAAYYADYMADLLPALLDHRQPEALDSVQAAVDNVHGAWQHAARRQRWDLLFKLATPLAQFVMVRRRIREFDVLLTQALEALGADPPEHEARKLLALLTTLYAESRSSLGTRSETIMLSERALALVREFPGEPFTAMLLIMLGNMRSYPGRLDDAGLALVDEGLALAEATGQPWAAAYGVLSMAWHYQNRVLYAEARQGFKEALARFRGMQQPWGIATSLGGLAESYATLGDISTARTISEAQLAPVQQIGDRLWLVHIRNMLNVFYASNEASADFSTALRIAWESGDRRSIAWTLYNAGWIALGEGRYDDADVTYAQAMTIFEEIDDVEGIGWTSVFQGFVALGKGNLKIARRKALHTLELVQNIEFPWLVAGANYLLGDVCLTENDLHAARTHYVEALDIAHQVQSAVQILRHTSGMAALLNAEGDPERALCLAHFVLAQEATPQDARARARALRDALLPALDAPTRKRAQQQAAKLTLTSAVTLALGNMEAKG